MKNWMMTTALVMFAGFAQAQSTGSLQVNGQPGKFQIFQKVKAVRCVLGQRGTCDAPVFFNLNTPQAVPTGTYLVGFENSIYPEPVNVDAGATTTLNLETVAVPAQVRGTKIRAFRDLSALIEQKKIYLTMFAMNRHFFRLDKENFGDLYLTGAWDRDYVQRFTYEVCPRLDSYGETAAAARNVCKAWNTAKEPNGLRDLFNFSSDGTFQEMWVTFPGDVVPSKHPRYLVSAPMTEADTIAVFPGVYRFQADGKTTSSAVKVGVIPQPTSFFGISLNTLKSFISLDGEDCSTARTWKTDSRAYCKDDRAEGCDRATAESCEPM